MHQATDDFSRTLDFRRTVSRKRIVAATLDHFASCSFCLNCEEHYALNMSLLIPFRLKRGYDKMVLEDRFRRKKLTHAVTVRFPPSQAAAPALEYMCVSTPLTMTETIVVFVTYAIANISALHVQETSCLLPSCTHVLMCSLVSIIMG
jgi:hypothetical protein